MSMIFKTTGRTGHEMIKMIRSFYCKETKKPQKIQLGKFRKSDIPSIAYDKKFVPKVIEELKEKGATNEEIAEAEDYINVLFEAEQEKAVLREKGAFLSHVKLAASAHESHLELLTETERVELWDSIKTIESKLRAVGITKPRKPRTKS
ncbi:hypothetical protein F2Z80_25255 [Vibrio fortis]|uniref:Uncharacterized protein n=2 Tax=Vibrio fortis TaxID=212667 RepID=A0A5N3RXT1_9VIBR|nr:hypothetical protein F2Z80_25195 [Vibrio fortis]KAB0299148.1 hypothetical protein F2Z80_25255 [Vibrio fortis]